MNEIGNIALQAAFIVTAYAAVGGLIGLLQRNHRLVASTLKATYVVGWLVTVAILCLTALLIDNDFNNRYVWSVSSEGLPLVYRISALWAGQAGSLLFWSWIFVLFAAGVAYSQRGRHRHLMPWVNAIIMANVFFFLWVNVFDANPFQQYFEVFPNGTTKRFTPDFGTGLNPQLHHPLMCIHPGVLYIGYIGFVVPFAFALGSLLAGDYSGRWLRITRRWTLFAWLSLGIGIVLGARWAYTELGWGGYWAWDPVENASLMPWLAATALLHSMLLQERQGMLKRWNIVLLTLTYLLCLFGAFLTRSGLISSVHAYAKSEVGKHFSVFMIIIIVLTVGLLLSRLNRLKGGRPLGSFFSRDGLLFWNNLFLLIGCLIVFVGTMMPALSELLSGQTREVEPTFFNLATPPVAIVLLVLLGMLPASVWKDAPLRGTIARALLPGVVALAVIVLLPLLGLVRHIYSVLALGGAAFAVVGVSKDFYDDVREHSVKKATGLWSSIVSQFRILPRRSGAHVAHLGIALMILGLAGAALNRQASGSLRVGEKLEMGSLVFQLEDVQLRETDLYEAATTTLTLWEGERQLKTLNPEARIYYGDRDKRTSEVGIHSNLLRDIYVVFGRYDSRGGGTAEFQIYVRPLVNWVWIGSILALAGSLFCFGRPKRERVMVPAGATEPAT